jgi:hypothetical protein
MRHEPSRAHRSAAVGAENPSSYAPCLRQTALPLMEVIQSRVGEQTQLVVLEHHDALCVERFSVPGPRENITEIAGRLPLNASSSGFILLAFGGRRLQDRILISRLPSIMPEAVIEPRHLRDVPAGIRRKAHVIASGSFSSGSTGVAVPIRDPTSEAVKARYQASCCQRRAKSGPLAPGWVLAIVATLPSFQGGCVVVESSCEEGSWASTALRPG